MRAVERLVFRPPTRRAPQRRRRLWIAMREKQRRTQRPEMKRPARSRSATSCGAQMRQRSFEVSARERSARGVLIQDVREHIELESLQRDGVRLTKTSTLVEREVEL